MAHDRKLVIGGVALVRVRLKNTGEAIDLVRDELEKVILQSDFLAAAPFKWIGLVFRYGSQDSTSPVYQRINKTHGDLPVSIEVDAQALVGADLEAVRAKFRQAAILTLLDVAEKYKLPTSALEELRVKLEH